MAHLHGMDGAAGTRAEALFLYSSHHSPSYCTASAIDLALTLTLCGEAWERQPGSAAEHVLRFACANAGGLGTHTPQCGFTGVCEQKSHGAAWN